MATRATYTFIEPQRDLKNSCYIHYDGYPMGAASYFEGMYQLMTTNSFSSRRRGGFVEQFLRANELAEVTVDADMHGDTEFHYDLISDLDSEVRIVAYKFTWSDKTLDGHNIRQRVQFYEGTLTEFLKRYSSQD
jgi:hypothetical protein